MYSRTNTCVCFCIYSYIQTHTHAHIRTHMHIHTQTYANIHTHINTHTHSYIHTHTYMCIIEHIYKLPHTHAPTHTTQNPSSPFPSSLLPPLVHSPAPNSCRPAGRTRRQVPHLRHLKKLNVQVNLVAGEFREFSASANIAIIASTVIKNSQK